MFVLYVFPILFRRGLPMLMKCLQRFRRMKKDSTQQAPECGA